MINDDKKNFENADTSTSVTFDIDVSPCPYVEVKKPGSLDVDY